MNLKRFSIAIIVVGIFMFLAGSQRGKESYTTRSERKTGQSIALVGLGIAALGGVIRFSIKRVDHSPADKNVDLSQDKPKSD